MPMRIDVNSAFLRRNVSMFFDDNVIVINVLMLPYVCLCPITVENLELQMCYIRLICKLVY